MAQDKEIEIRPEKDFCGRSELVGRSDGRNPQFSQVSSFLIHRQVGGRHRVVPVDGEMDLFPIIS